MVESLSTVCRCFGYIDNDRHLRFDVKKLNRSRMCKGRKPNIRHIELEENRQSLLGDNKHKWVHDKDSSIVIIGANAAGIHMASILKTHGFHNVIIVEKENNYGGTCISSIVDTESNDIIHEMGTAYIHSNYDAFFELMGLYDDSNNELIPIRNDQCNIYTKDRTQFLANDWTLNNDKMAVIIAAQKYKTLHNEIFGDYLDESGLNISTQYPPKPHKMKRIDMSFLTFITKHELDALIPYFVFRNSMLESYGHLNEIPAFYGLLWNNPRSIKTLINHKMQKRENLWMLKKGFSHLFGRIIDLENIEIVYNASITSINRYLNDEKHKICLMYIDEESDNEKLIECDVLFCASNMRSLCDIISDITTEERQVFDGILSHTLCTTLFECDHDEKQCVHALTFYPNNLLRKDGHLYKIRNSRACLLKSKKNNKERYIAYQMVSKDPQNVDICALQKLFKKDVRAIGGFNNVHILKQNVMRFCPRWTQTHISNGAPWLIKDEFQGKYKSMYYIGASVASQQIESILEYNIELQHKLHL